MTKIIDFRSKILVFFKGILSKNTRCNAKKKNQSKNTPLINLEALFDLSFWVNTK